MFPPQENSLKQGVQSSHFWRDLSQVVRRTPLDKPVPLYTRTSPLPKLRTQLTKQPPRSAFKGNFFVRVRLRRLSEYGSALIFFSLPFWISLFFLFKEILAFLSVFCLFSKDFRGSPARTNPCCFCGFFLVFPKRQGKEGQGPTKASPKEFCDTIVASIARYESIATGPLRRELLPQFESLAFVGGSFSRKTQSGAHRPYVRCAAIRIAVLRFESRNWRSFEKYWFHVELRNGLRELTAFAQPWHLAIGDWRFCPSKLQRSEVKNWKIEKMAVLGSNNFGPDAMQSGFGVNCLFRSGEF